MSLETTVFGLLMVASAVALLARRLRLPYTVTLVVAGLALGAVAPDAYGFDLDAVHLTEEVLFHVFLPILLFEAAFHVSWSKFRANLRAILLLALPGVVLAVAAGGLFAFLFEHAAGSPLPLAVAFLVASILAATDPVSVVALFKELGVPKRLAVIVEGESLLNDAVGVVAFTVCSALLGIASVDEPINGLWVARFLFWEIGVGLVAGVGVGLLVSWATTLVDDHLVEIMLTTVAAFGSYLVASALHASPILAVVAAGMACGNVGARYGMTPANRIAVGSFWEYCVFAANGFVFLLIGREIDLARLWTHAGPIAAAWAALTIARALVVIAVERGLARTRERMPRRWSVVLVWGGLRGALSMVLAMSLPESFPERALVIDLTFGVVLLSILVQGPTMTPVLRWANAITGGEGGAEYTRLRVVVAAVRAALRHLDKSYSDGAIDASTHQALRTSLAGREAQIEEQLAHLETGNEARADELERTKLELEEVERREIQSAADRGLIPSELVPKLFDDLNAPVPRSKDPAAEADS